MMLAECISTLHDGAAMLIATAQPSVGHAQEFVVVAAGGRKPRHFSHSRGRSNRDGHPDDITCLPGPVTRRVADHGTP
jgi:hypothetical protein